jgi:hypothetical protein
LAFIDHKNTILPRNNKNCEGNPTLNSKIASLALDAKLEAFFVLVTKFMSGIHRKKKSRDEDLPLGIREVVGIKEVVDISFLTGSR